MITFLVSPHLDDAALGAYSVITGTQSRDTESTIVVTCFAGLPTTGTDSAARARVEHRRSEDYSALSDYAELIHLDFLDHPFAGVRNTHFVIELAQALLELITPLATVWLPAGIGRHPDHLLARDAGLIAGCSLPSISIGFYAEVSYIARRGWPCWFQRSSRTTRSLWLEPSVWIPTEANLSWWRGAGTVTRICRSLPSVFELTAEEQVDKLHLIRRYVSQAVGLGFDEDGPNARGSRLAYEALWLPKASQDLKLRKGRRRRLST